LRNISIPIDLQFKLFDTLILPILTYGCEIWGYENTKQLEKLHQQTCTFLKVFVQNFLVCIHTEYIFLRKYYYQVKLGSHEISKFYRKRIEMCTCWRF
jgi:hypothetical protein